MQGSSHSRFHGTGNWLASHSGCCVSDDFGSSAVQDDNNINNPQTCTNYALSQSRRTHFNLQTTYICVCEHTLKITPRISFYAFRQQGNLLHF